MGEFDGGEEAKDEAAGGGVGGSFTGVGEELGAGVWVV